MDGSTDAKTLGLARAAQAAMRAEREARLIERPAWTVNTVLELATWLEALPEGATFTIEEAREFCSPMPAHTDARAWGHVTKRALVLGLIEATGEYRPTTASHGSPKMLYRRGRLR